MKGARPLAPVSPLVAVGDSDDPYSVCRGLRLEPRQGEYVAERPREPRGFLAVIHYYDSAVVVVVVAVDYCSRSSLQYTVFCPHALFFNFPSSCNVDNFLCAVRREQSCISAISTADTTGSSYSSTDSNTASTDVCVFSAIVCIVACSG
jgi:hypothetical protein